MQNRKTKLKSIITCPKCGFKKEETMPTDQCQVLYKCSNCKEKILELPAFLGKQLGFGLAE